MQPDTPTPRAMRYTGYALSILPSLMLLMAAFMNITQNETAVKGAAEVGYAQEALLPLGVITLLGVILYLVPQTSILGAILLTGYLGGAVATHVIAGDGLAKILFPAIFGAILWLGLWLRDSRLRSLTPIRR